MYRGWEDEVKWVEWKVVSFEGPPKARFAPTAAAEQLEPDPPHSLLSFYIPTSCCFINCRILQLHRTKG